MHRVSPALGSFLILQSSAANLSDSLGGPPYSFVISLASVGPGLGFSSVISVLGPIGDHWSGFTDPDLRPRQSLAQRTSQTIPVKPYP